MIGKYPRFTRLNIDHQNQINDFTMRFEPYSDFNFVSLFSWNFNDSAEVSLLNENMVIKIPDYITEKPILSIIGTDKINESLNVLLRETRDIKLVPEPTIKAAEETVRFHFTNDLNNYDYVYDLNDQANLLGGDLKKKRNRVNRFAKNYGERAKILELNCKDRDKVLELETIIDKWGEEKQKDPTEIKNEKRAIRRCLDNAENFNLECYEILIDGKIVGFSINEILSRQWANCHFQKTLLSYDNIDVYLTNYVAKQLLAKGCKYVNWEQDLGIPGLRELKQSYKPVKMLKKYKVEQ